MVPIDKKINAFILAAGFGERLRPITYYIPKPMLPMLGRPVLQYVTERVLTLPVDKIGINLHHKKKVVEDWIRQSSFCEKTIFFPEEAILGTGGALKNAEALLSNKPFLVHNSDIVSDINLEKLLEHHCASENLATLAVHDCPKFNTVVIGRNGFLKGLGTAQDNGRRLAFTGIAVYSPEFLRFIPSGASSVVDAWQKAISSGYRIGTLDVSGCHWNDIGTPSAYASAVLHALRADGEVVYVHPTVDKCNKSDIQGYVVIEKGCILDSGTSLRNCIMLPASRAQGGLRYENCILGPDFTINLDEREISGLAEENGRQLIGTGGSDRRYYRMKDNNNSVVLMQCNSNDPDFARHIEYAIFFLKHCVPVPALINVEFEKMLAIFEDAGDISLYSYLKCLRDESDIEDIYRQVIDAMIQLHIEATEHVAECPLLQKRIFDYEYFRWETDYFMKRFIEGVRKINRDNVSSLEKEFHDLASKADSFPKTVIHRDYQSQNIMILKGQGLRIIDYQGSRIGPPAYDVASLLWDPYYRIEDDIRERLLHYYVNQMKDKMNGNHFRDTLLLCRLQRHMQALGAYGFLSSVKGKKYFLKYVAEGVRLLKEDALLAENEYPELSRLIREL